MLIPWSVRRGRIQTGTRKCKEWVWGFPWRRRSRCIREDLLRMADMRTCWCCPCSLDSICIGCIRYWWILILNETRKWDRTCPDRRFPDRGSIPASVGERKRGSAPSFLSWWWIRCRWCLYCTGGRACQVWVDHCYYLIMIAFFWILDCDWIRPVIVNDWLGHAISGFNGYLYRMGCKRSVSWIICSM